MKLQERDLVNIVGGAVSATMINAVARAVSTLIELGRIIGSSISRIKNNNMC